MNKSDYYIAAFNKAKIAFNVDSDMALSNVLGIHRSSLSKLKSRGSFPYKHILDTCVAKNISVDFILGINPEKKSNGAE